MKKKNSKVDEIKLIKKTCMNNSASRFPDKDDQDISP